MKVKISYTFTVDDEVRKAIAHYRGEEGKATHAHIKDFVEEYGRDFTGIIRSYHTARADYHQGKAKK